MSFEQPTTKTPMHEKARREKGLGYPDRFPVPDEKVLWSTEYPEYQPPYHIDDHVLSHIEGKEGGLGWAHSEDVSQVDLNTLESYEGHIDFDEKGRPLNPHGRTGIEGRGLLGKWGPNFTADSIITRELADGSTEILLIKRDNQQWALPGGIVDKGEKLSATAARELNEETGVNVDMSTAVEVYKGYVDDPRNTDNAWFETSAYHIHLTLEQTSNMRPKAGDDAIDVQWVVVTDELVGNLYANHGELVEAALKNI